MSSSRSRLGAAVTPGLAGLSIAAGIAREAVDAVPIVKQVLGVVVRILALAEKIDKDRDALHELVKKSLQLAERVKAVLGGRTGDDVFQPSIDRIRGVFEEIAEYMQKHVSRSRLSRAFGYAFTVKLHVDRLARKLEDAVQELFMVAQITTTLAVNDSARFDGEFRLFRHCEVDKLELIRENLCKNADGNTMVRYHRARVDGTPVVVRILSSDRILEELSTVEKSHRNVARVYGHSKGPIHNRFTVFKAGFRPVDTLMDEMPDPISILVKCTCKLLDAVDHLRQLGISWKPSRYALDEHLEPTIGLGNDLRRIDPEIDPLREIADQLWSTLWPLPFRFRVQEVATTDVRAAAADCHNEPLTTVLGKFETTQRRRFVIPKSSLLSGFALAKGTAERLLRLLAEDDFDHAWRINPWLWADILLALDRNGSHSLRTGIRVLYVTEQDGSERLMVYCMAEDSERIVCDHNGLEIPRAQRGEVRAILGIAAPSEEPDNCPTGGPGTSRAPE